MFGIILYAVVFAGCTIFLQWILYKVRRNHNKGKSAILGFLVGDEVGKQKTIEQIQRDNIEKYKKSLEIEKEKLEKSDNPNKVTNYVPNSRYVTLRILV